MATASDMDLRQEGTVFDCPICLERLKVPKYLPCLHTFCEQCIHSYIETCARTPSRSEVQTLTFECPVCRQKVVAPEADVTPENWANKLPLNHLLLSLLDNKVKLTPTCDQGGSVLCEPCKRVNERKSAKFYCSNCDDSLCETCFSYLHRRVPHYKNHNITDISASPHKIYSSSVLEVEHCSIHKNKPLDFYCLDHEELSCSVCFYALHKKCVNIKTVNEVADKLNPEQIDGIFSTMKAKTESEIQKTNVNLDRLKDQHKRIQTDVVCFVEEIKNKLDGLQSKFLKDLEVTHENEKSQLSNTQMCLENFLETLTRSAKTLKATSNTSSKRQLFLTSEWIRTQLIKDLDDIEKQNKHQGHVEYEMEEDPVMKSINSVETLCNIHVKRDRKSIIPDLNKGVDSLKCVISLPKPRISLMKDPASVTVNHVASYCVKCPEDTTTPWVTGGVFLENGSLIIVDKHNHSIKEVSPSGSVKVLFSKKTEDIRGICHSGRDETIFVSMGENISEFSLSPSFKYLRDLKTEKMEFYQLISLNDCIFAHTGNPWCVREIQKDGTVLKTLNGSNCGFGFFTISCDAKSIIYSKSGSVICDEINSGEEVFQCSQAQMGINRKGVKGLGVDIYNNVYICDCKEGCVVQISKDGQQIRRILPALHVIKKPYALCFDKNGKRFFVSSWLEYHGMVEVYELKF
ncbi:E3 ubiquitin-protein ligase TRIM45-like [Saccostrea cucullata]|uniref:E3 ubiquitin-protein ligase TRIM45-like n=1 Tax=Saccostrea cuccullata TaxID=36930 RepID=UPI002ED1B2F1